jgi:chromosome partitioning protein
MKTVVIASRKGGVGKTTMSAHLGVAAEADDFGPVALIDIDTQESLAKWWNKRLAPTPMFSAATLANLKQHLAALKQSGVKLTIIDTPPQATETIREVISHADLVLIPTRPSSLDLEAVGATIEMAEAAGKRMVFIINGAANRARITGQAAVALSQHGTVAPVTVYQRDALASAMTDGRTAGEIDSKSKAAEEIADLWSYVRTQLSKKVVK